MIAGVHAVIQIETIRRCARKCCLGDVPARAFFM
jgi:hypothetical protein